MTPTTVATPTGDTLTCWDNAHLTRALLSEVFSFMDLPFTADEVVDLTPAQVSAQLDDHFPAHLPHRRVRELAHDAERAGQRFVIPSDPEWPAQLNALGPHRPAGLWVLGPGNLAHASHGAIAITGSHASSDYASHLARTMSSELASGTDPHTIATGMAWGVDTFAALGALDAHGQVIGVCAGGIDTSPHAMNHLTDQMRTEQLLISETPAGSTATRRLHHARQRLLAALTTATVIVEALPRSSCLSAAHWAQQLHRPVMAVPGRVDTLASIGPHQLIATGSARLVTCADDVRSVLTQTSA